MTTKELLEDIRVKLENISTILSEIKYSRIPEDG